MRETVEICMITSLLLMGAPSQTPLEMEIKADLDNLTTDADFTLTVVAENGRTFTHSTGNSTISTPYESASTSKWITATIILWLVQDESVPLSLNDNPQNYIPTWPDTGNLSEITLHDLLNFTSGLSIDPLCQNFPNFNFEACVRQIASVNDRAKFPGEEFNYGSSHLQVAGMMAIKALNFNTWQQVFEKFQSEEAVFPESSYNIPSPTNPRLSGGMTWTGRDYRDFLIKLKNLEILEQPLFDAMHRNQITTAQTGSSPGPEEWRYGYGTWVECPSTEKNCPDADRVSSPGYFGAYPFIDFGHNYYGILAREGENGTFRNGLAVVTSINEKLEMWADQNQNQSSEK